MNDNFARRIAITGGAGFIGSNLAAYLLPRYPDYFFIILDCLTYAGNQENLASVAQLPNYRFERIDIRDQTRLLTVLHQHDVDGIIHLAAETHVDRSIVGPSNFVTTNIVGTFNLLEYVRTVWERGKKVRFHHVSTDEVFGSIERGAFTENSPFNPSSPYAASKAASDHLVSSYHKTYGIDTITTNCSNNYGPFQFPEKLIPLMIRNALAELSFPVYGDGQQRRDWLYVTDHCRALEMVFHNGKSGEVYLVGGGTDISNLELVRRLCQLLSKKTDNEYERLISFVADRPAHDRRYAVDHSKLTRELGWKPSTLLDEGLERTIEWYLENRAWMARSLKQESAVAR